MMNGDIQYMYIISHSLDFIGTLSAISLNYCARPFFLKYVPSFPVSFLRIDQIPSTFPQTSTLRRRIFNTVGFKWGWKGWRCVYAHTAIVIVDHDMYLTRSVTHIYPQFIIQPAYAHATGTCTCASTANYQLRCHQFQPR